MKHSQERTLIPRLLRTPSKVNYDMSQFSRPVSEASYLFFFWCLSQTLHFISFQRVIFYFSFPYFSVYCMNHCFFADVSQGCQKNEKTLLLQLSTITYNDKVKN